MAAVANVAINLDSRGVPTKLKQIADRSKELEKAAQGASTAVTKTGRELKTAANGMQYFIDATGRARKINGQFVTTAEAAAAGLDKQGRSVVGAAAKLKSFGAALNSALGPIGLALSGLAGLGAAFQTLQQQDFAEAKVRSLGTNSEQLVTQLKSLSNELKGQASVTELTAAAYDVASAGFVDAADAVNVLKAASLGAVGGFSDINTVGNAATSVLNAYEMSAANATSVVDKFIQTQNDGKIVVAEYAQNIGKVASAAAGLGIPLEEVNAVIAQATASGVQADVAFTGLKGALARLASGEASKALKDVGIDINAASLESDGLLGTLQKLQGLDTGQIFKALGTEAGPALLPVLNNLKRYEELISRQKDSTGAAARAQSEAANTIQGALKRLQTAFQNAFADQSSLGKALKVILLGAAVTVEALASAFDLIIAPIEAVAAATGAFGKAIANALGIDSQQKLQDFEQGWQSIRSGVETVSNVIVAFGQATGQLLADLTITAFKFGQDLIAAFEGPINTITGFWQEFSRFVVDAWNGAATSVNTTASNLWSSISDGVRGIIGAIGQAFADAFAEAFKQIKAFYNQLPGWLRGALEGAANVGSAVTGAVQSALGRVGTALGEAGETLNRAFTPPAVNQGGNGPTRPLRVGDTIDDSTIAGGGSKKGKGKVDKAADELKRQQEAGAALLTQQKRQIQLKLVESNLEKELLQIDFNRLDALKRIENIAPGQRGEATAQANTLAQMQAGEVIGKTLADQILKEQALQQAREDALRPLEQERGLLEAKLNGTEKEFRLRQQVDEIMRQTPGLERATVEELVKGNQALEQRVTQMQEMEQLLGAAAQRLGKGLEDALVATIEAAVTGAKDLGETLQEIAAGVLKDIGRMFIQAGIKGAMSGLGIPGFADGGRPQVGQVSIVGEKGPELFVPDTAGTVVPNNQLSSAMGPSGGYVTSNSASQAAMDRYSSGNARGGSISVNYNVTDINGMRFVTEDQFRAGVAQAAKRGADGGFNRTMSSLKNNRSTRSRVGV